MACERLLRAFTLLSAMVRWEDALAMTRTASLGLVTVTVVTPDNTTRLARSNRASIFAIASSCGSHRLLQHCPLEVRHFVVCAHATRTLGGQEPERVAVD